MDMDKNQLAVICDFDGTITRMDVGHQIYTRFGDERWLEINKQWRRGEISSKDCLIGEYELIDADEKEVMEHILKMDIDPGFMELVNICKANNVPIAVASDGFDFYINAVLEKYGLANMEVFCNEMKFNGRKVELSFPYYEKGCGVCGNCKRIHIENFKNDSRTVIYIGDGLSDRYAAKAADVVFAKDELMEYLVDNNVEFIQFGELKEVTGWMEELLSGRINLPASNGKKIADPCDDRPSILQK